MVLGGRSMVRTPPPGFKSQIPAVEILRLAYAHNDLGKKVSHWGSKISPAGPQLGPKSGGPRPGKYNQKSEEIDRAKKRRGRNTHIH